MVAINLLLSGSGNSGNRDNNLSVSSSGGVGTSFDTEEDNSNKVMHGIALYDHNRTSANELHPLLITEGLL